MSRRHDPIPSGEDRLPEHRVPGHERFELRRRSDDVVYRFARAERADGRAGYRREDADVWFVRDARFGWITVLGDQDDVIVGLPWGVLAADQGDVPPEGDWVSRKGDKSYVYTLVHVNAVGEGEANASPNLVVDP